MTANAPIHKLELPTAKTFSVPGKIIHVGLQRGIPTCWYLADGFDRRYNIVFTGSIPDPYHTYVGTIVDDVGTGLVFHIFED